MTKNICEDCENYKPKEEKSKTNENRLTSLRHMRARINTAIDSLDPVDMSNFCGLPHSFDCTLCPLITSGDECTVYNIAGGLRKLKSKLDKEIKEIDK